jgi:hypothetical protein
VRDWLVLATSAAVEVIDWLALIVIVLGAAEAFLRGVWTLFASPDGHVQPDAWLRLGRRLVAASRSSLPPTFSRPPSPEAGAFGVGGLLGATGLLAVPAEQDRRWWSSRFAVLYGLIVTFVALVPWFWGVPLLMIFAGAAMTVSNTSANSILQGAANPHLLGQTVSLFMLATRGGIPLGALLTGLSTEMVGVRPTLLANGASAVVVHLVIGRAWLRSLPPKTAATSRIGAAT